MLPFNSLLSISFESFVEDFDLRFRGAGVYCIRCFGNERIYIGSTNNFCERLDTHCRRLLKGNHHSVLLQRSFNKYGARSIVFYLVEQCPEDRMVEREQWYMDSERSWDPQFGFNISKEAGRTKHTKETIERVTEMRASPFHLVKDGVHFEGKNIARFARERGLTASSLTEVIRGRKPIFKGFHLPEYVAPKKKHKIVDPSGAMHEFNNVRKFALAHGLCPRALGFVVRRHRKYSHTAGWHLPDVELPKPKEYELADPTGRVHAFSNITRFAKEHGLSPVTVGNILRKQKGAHTTKGWHLPGVITARIREYCVLSPAGVKYTFNNIAKFAKEHQLNNLHSLLVGKTTHTKNWRIHNNE